MGVEVDEKGFHPTYTTLADKRKIVSELAKASKAAGTVYLATDPDREGEAISWHVIRAAKIDEAKVKRVVFHEITSDAIREAFEHPRALDEHLIDAQQARRILDRLVGYRLSPVLWGKVRRGLSAGRVQSVALRLVVDREGEIQGFVPVEFWSIEASLAKQQHGGEAASFDAQLQSIKGVKGKLEIPNEARAQEITSDLRGAAYEVASVRRREAHNRPGPPFITSTMQQEAARRLRFTARRTMQIAQQLYEGLSIGDEGSVGLITYMRTDSTNVAAAALQEASRYIKSRFGPSMREVTQALQEKSQGSAGGSRSHQAHLDPARAGGDPPAPVIRAVPALSAHMEADAGQSDDRRTLRFNDGGHSRRGQRLGLGIRLQGDRVRAEIRWIPHPVPE